jgi:long-chain fatty acid transport protein
MKRILMTTAAVAGLSGAASAGGIDRSGQGLGALFEAGRYFELSLGHVAPSIDGRDLLGGATGDVGTNYTQWAFSYKFDVNDKLSFALNVDKPFGADVVYAPTSPLLGNTTAVADSTAVTGILRYKLNGGLSVHGGLRAQQADGFIRLGGLAYGPLNGYNVTLDNDVAAGYLIGVAYEKPEIALRVALTYNSSITHKMNSTQSAPFPSGTITEVETPQSVNLDFQSGVAKDTLVFGQIRWVDWSSFLIDPVGFPGTGLVDLDDSTTFSLGVGRRLNEKWAASLSFSYEATGDSDLVSPLAPTDGRLGVTLGASYTMDNMKVSMGVNYTKVGDARPETGTPDTARALMTNNDVLGIGVKVGWSF